MDTKIVNVTQDGVTSSMDALTVKGAKRTLYRSKSRFGKAGPLSGTLFGGSVKQAFHVKQGSLIRTKNAASAQLDTQHTVLLDLYVFLFVCAA